MPVHSMARHRPSALSSRWLLSIDGQFLTAAPYISPLIRPRRIQWEAYGGIAKNILIAASMVMFEKRCLKNLDLMHQKKNLLFGDSGCLGWIKSEKYCTKAFEEYACQTSRVLNIQAKLNPDIYASEDIPCEDFILDRAGINIEQAIAQTVKDAQYLRGVQLWGKIKCFPVQGYTPEEYEYCIAEYRRLGFFDLEESIHLVCSWLYLYAKTDNWIVPNQ